MKDIIMECSYYIVGLVCMVCVGEWTFHWTVRDWKRFLLAGVVYSVAVWAQFVPVSSKMPMFMLISIGEFLAWGLLCKGSVRDKLHRMLGVYYGVSFVELIIIVLFDLTLGLFEYTDVIQPVTSLVTLGIMAIVSRFQWYKNLIVYFGSLTKKKAILIWTIVVGGIYLVTLSMSVQSMLSDVIFLIIFRGVLAIELCAMATVVLLMVMDSHQRKYYQEQSSLKDEVIRTQQDYYRTIYEKDQEMRSFRHDISSHLGVLKILLDRGEIQKAREQLNSLEEEFQQASFKQVHVGDDVLDAILSMMNRKAHQKGIILEVKGSVQKQEEHRIYELCTIISNAINNAVEACERIGKKGPISIKFMEHNDTICIVVENPATEEMYQAIIAGKSKKTDAANHGYGVQNIRRAVDRLQGSLEYGYEDDRVKLEIYI